MIEINMEGYDTVRPRVLMFAYAVDNKDVGEAQLTYQWIAQISKKVDVTLITMGSRIHDKCGFESNENVNLYIVKPKMLFRWAGSFDRVFKPDYLELYARARKAAKDILITNKFDALHHIAPHSPRYPSPLHGLHSNFLVGPIHGGLALPNNFSSQNIKTKMAAILRKVDALRNKHDNLMRAHFSSARKLLVSAPYVKGILPEEFAAKCTVIPPQPPDKSEHIVSPRQVSKPIKFLFVGRLIENKGVRYALEALKGIPKTDYIFNVYGTGEQELELKKIVEDSDMTSTVKFKGFASHEIILSEMLKHDVLLFPSLKEAWGLVVTEAMSAGLAIVCADRGGPGYIVDDSCGLKVPADTPSQLVNDLNDAIYRMIDNPELIHSMKSASQQRVEKQFTWDVLTNQILNLYKGGK